MVKKEEARIVEGHVCECAVNNSYSKFTYNMMTNGDSLTIRTDSFDELVGEVDKCKDLVIEKSLIKKTENDKKALELPQNIPDFITPMDACKKCGCTDLLFNHGKGKNGKTWYAFDCTNTTCQERNWCDVKVVEKTKPTELPKITSEHIAKEEIKCAECKKILTFGIKKHCEKDRADKGDRKYLCFQCQQKEQK